VPFQTRLIGGKYRGQTHQRQQCHHHNKNRKVYFHYRKMYDYQDDSDDEEYYSGITCIKAMSRDRESVIYGNGSGGISIFDTRSKQTNALTLYSRNSTGELVDLSHECGITAIEVLSDNQVVSGAADGSVSIWYVGLCFVFDD
jgi:WD40 repeat protein